MSELILVAWVKGHDLRLQSTGFSINTHSITARGGKPSHCASAYRELQCITDPSCTCSIVNKKYHHSCGTTHAVTVTYRLYTFNFNSPYIYIYIYIYTYTRYVNRPAMADGVRRELHPLCHCTSQMDIYTHCCYRCSEVWSFKTVNHQGCIKLWKLH